MTGPELSATRVTLLARLFRPLFQLIAASWHMFPLGFYLDWVSMLVIMRTAKSSSLATMNCSRAQDLRMPHPLLENLA